MRRRNFFELGAAALAAPQVTRGQTTPRAAPSTAPSTAPSAATGSTDPRMQRIRDHLSRYRELAAQGKWSEAGKELEAIEAEARQ